MLAVIGTVPDPQFPLTHGPVRRAGDDLVVDGRNTPVHRGTPALLAAALAASVSINGPDIYAFLIGDIGIGNGSREMYRFLEQHLSEYDCDVLTFHYLQPDVDWHNKILFAVEALKRRPILIADAGFMYAAKMSGQAPAYDFFTPDAGELAFLADDAAPHPFYTRGFILHRNNPVPELIRRAYRHKNAARRLVVKGETDVIADEAGVIETVDHPSFDAMEAIGGTGDTLTGLLTVLCGAGFDPVEAAILAARVNRRTGAFPGLSPATQIAELIDGIPKALTGALEDRHKGNPYGK